MKNYYEKQFLVRLLFIFAIYWLEYDEAMLPCGILMFLETLLTAGYDLNGKFPVKTNPEKVGGLDGSTER